MIQINDKLRIVKIDERNLQLEEYREVENIRTKERRMDWTWVGYYGDLKSAFIGALKKCLFDLSEEEKCSVENVVAKINEIENDIKIAISKLKENTNGDNEEKSCEA